MLTGIEARMQEPTARGLAAAVSGAIRDGAIGAGERLPPIRTVATELGLSPTTVSAAWALLARSGTIHTDGRRGTTVAAPHRERYSQAVDSGARFALDLSTGVPDPALLPPLAGALAALVPDAATASYLEDPVVPELRDLLEDHWPYDPPALTVVDGAMDGLDLATRVLVGFGDRVAVEDPCFPPLLDLLEAGGAEVIGIPLDEQGMSAAALRAAGPVRAVYLQPRAQNPTGITLSTARMRELAAAIGDSTVVIEDDSAGGVASSPALSLGELLPDRTVHVRSFAKSHGPELRLAALGGPVDIVDRIAAVRRRGQGWSSRLLQRLLLGVLTDRPAVRAVQAARVEYARRRSALVAALEAEGVTVGGTDGINLWLPVVDETAAVVRLASAGIGVTPGGPFTVRPGQPAHVRVTAGLVASGFAELAATLAAAAVTGTTRVPV